MTRPPAQPHQRRHENISEVCWAFWVRYTLSFCNTFLTSLGASPTSWVWILNEKHRVSCITKGGRGGGRKGKAHQALRSLVARNQQTGVTLPINSSSPDSHISAKCFLELLIPVRSRLPPWTPHRSKKHLAKRNTKSNWPTKWLPYSYFKHGFKADANLPSASSKYILRGGKKNAVCNANKVCSAQTNKVQWTHYVTIY